MRALRADEIEVRVGQIYEKGVSMLLYKTARTDMQVLDEMYGKMNWQKDYKEIKGNLYCGIGVYDSNKDEWVWKWDCGTESNTEREKGEASDAMKRSAFNWQIGRELYTAPFIWLTVATVAKPNGGYRLHNPRELNGIFVSNIESREINGKLTITKLELAQKVNGIAKIIYYWEKEDNE